VKAGNDGGNSGKRQTRPAHLSWAGIVIATPFACAYFASGSIRIWSFTIFGRSPLPMPSSQNALEVLVHGNLR
jgi:hypothetical protein